MNVHFTPNEPQTLALQEPRSEKFGDYQITCTLTDGRLLKVSKAIAAKINELDLQPGETFKICKQIVHSEQRRRDSFDWSVWLSPETEKARGHQEIKQPLTLADVKRPGKVRNIRKTAPEQGSILFDKGAGTFGPAPLPHSLRLPRIPFNQSFTEILRFVATGLKEQGEQWNDESKQDMVSTVFIAAATAGLLSLWER